MDVHGCCSEEFLDASPSSQLTILTNAEDPVKFSRPNAREHGLVKPWEGETIHEVSLGREDLELTLGSSTFKGC
jgi:hypothetical protein